MYKIGEFAKLVNIPVKTLRYYDEINLFKPSYTEPFTNYRYYEDKQIEEINYIKKLKELNLSLNEIMTYVKSKDISILKNKSFETNEKLDVLNDYIDDEIYTVKKGDYNDYLKNWGLLYAETYFALSIKNNNLKYYIVEKENEYYFDLGIYQDDNQLAIVYDNLLFANDIIVKKVFDFIFQDGNKEVIYSVCTDRYDYDIASIITKNLLVSKITKEQQGGREFNLITISGVRKEEQANEW